MSMEFLPPISPLPAVAPSLAPAMAPADGPMGAFGAIDPSSAALPGHGAASVFSTAVTKGLRQVDGNLQASQADLQRLAAGDVSSLHQVMVRLEESRLSMQLVIQVRNRLLESYQELMRMQV